MNPRISTKKHDNQRQRKIKGSKEKVTWHIHRFLNKIISGFLSRNSGFLQARKQGYYILKCWKKKICQLRTLYQAKHIYFKNKETFKILSDKQKLRELITSSSASREILKGVLQVEKILGCNLKPLKI